MSEIRVGFAVHPDFFGFWFRHGFFSFAADSVTALITREKGCTALPINHPLPTPELSLDDLLGCGMAAICPPVSATK